MASDIKAVETVYNGHRFRSRLEARWAVFFDCCGIKYEYEVEGYKTGESYYLPDFYLPEYDTHVEVKGERDGVWKELEKAARFIRWGGPIKRILILGNIPTNFNKGRPFFPCIYFDPLCDRPSAGWWYWWGADEDDVGFHGELSDRPYTPPWYIEEDGSITSASHKWEMTIQAIPEAVLEMTIPLRYRGPLQDRQICTNEDVFDAMIFA
jgi:hypothetical protein